jgi:hypothetical protein
MRLLSPTLGQACLQDCVSVASTGNFLPADLKAGSTALGCGASQHGTACCAKMRMRCRVGEVWECSRPHGDSKVCSVGDAPLGWLSALRGSTPPLQAAQHALSLLLMRRRLPVCCKVSVRCAALTVRCTPLVLPGLPPVRGCCWNASMLAPNMSSVLLLLHMESFRVHVLALPKQLQYASQWLLLGYASMLVQICTFCCRRCTWPQL